MFQVTFTVQSLLDCLAGLPPVELKGMVLLRQHHPAGQFFPTGLPREVVAQAVTEIVGYTQRCQRAVQQLSELEAVPLTAFAIVEYGL